MTGSLRLTTLKNSIDSKDFNIYEALYLNIVNSLEFFIQHAKIIIIRNKHKAWSRGLM